MVKCCRAAPADADTPAARLPFDLSSLQRIPYWTEKNTKFKRAIYISQLDAFKWSDSDYSERTVERELPEIYKLKTGKSNWSY